MSPQQIPAGHQEAADGAVLLDRSDRVLTVTLNRPEKLNALSPAMFTALESLGAALQADATVRVVVFRGAGGKALAAGADIAAFTHFTGTDDAVAYEAGVVRALGGVERAPQVTIAVVEGLAVGGGLALASACDLRVATPDARLGYPIAATLGNTLSAAVLRRCVAVFGDSLVREMLLTATLLDAQRAYSCGAVMTVMERDGLDEAVAALADRIATLAPTTQLATKQILGMLSAGSSAGAPSVDDEQIIRAAYGSDDFSGAVRAFLSKQRPTFSAELPL